MSVYASMFDAVRAAIATLTASVATIPVAPGAAPTTATWPTVTNPTNITSSVVDLSGGRGVAAVITSAVTASRLWHAVKAGDLDTGWIEIEGRGGVTPATTTTCAVGLCAKRGTDLYGMFSWCVGGDPLYFQKYAASGDTAGAIINAGDLMMSWQAGKRWWARIVSTGGNLVCSVSFDGGGTTALTRTYSETQAFGSAGAPSALGICAVTTRNTETVWINAARRVAP